MMYLIIQSQSGNSDWVFRDSITPREIGEWGFLFFKFPKYEKPNQTFDRCVKRATELARFGNIRIIDGDTSKVLWMNGKLV